jgi:hypothetical protein
MSPSLFRESYCASKTTEELDSVVTEAARAVPTWSRQECLDLFLALRALVDDRNERIRADIDPEQAALLRRLEQIDANTVCSVLQRDEMGPSVSGIERDLILDKLRQMGFPHPFYDDLNEERMTRFACSLLMSILVEPSPGIIKEVRRALEDDYQPICFDLPIGRLEILLAGWQTANEMRSMVGCDVPSDYFEQLRRKAGPKVALPFVEDRLCGYDDMECSQLVRDFLPHALTKVYVLERWCEVLAGRGHEDGGFDVLAQEVRAHLGDATPLASLEAYLSQDRPDAEALSLAFDALRRTGAIVQVAKDSLSRLLARDRKLISPDIPGEVRLLLTDEALALAVDYTALDGVARPSVQTTCAMLTLCIQRHIAAALGRSEGVPNEWRNVVPTLAMGALLRLIRGDHISDLDGAAVSPKLGQEALAALRDVARLRNAIHHPRGSVRPDDVRRLRHLVFENASFLRQLSDLRLIHRP